MFGRIAKEYRRGGGGDVKDEKTTPDESKEVPRSRRLAIKISEYETLNVEPYHPKKNKKKGKGKMRSTSRSPVSTSSQANSKRSAVFDYGNIYQDKEDDDNYFMNSSITPSSSSSLCSSNQTISSYGSNPSLISGQSLHSQGSQQLKQLEARFHSPIRTREPQLQRSSPPPEGGNPLDIKTRIKKG